MESCNCLFITFVEKEGPFLKVWGQTDKDSALYVEQILHNFTQQLDNAIYIPSPESFRIGELYYAKYNDNKYYRARVTNLHLQNNYIQVNFVDYGNHDLIPLTNVRSLQALGELLQQIPPQAHAFLLAEAICNGTDWNPATLAEISNEIRYTEVNFSIIAKIRNWYFVRLFVSTNDITILLITRGLMRHLTLPNQEVIISSMSRPQVPVIAQPAPQPQQQNLAGYKTFMLEPGQQYEVYVSYVSDGPSNFSVQLKQSEEMLGKLMKEINSIALTPLEGFPIPGSVCLARCLEDGNICRAVVTNEVDAQYKVFYVDFGNFEIVSFDGLFEIPFKFVIPKVVAIRFSLANIDKSNMTFEMLCAFKTFVDNRLLHLKVLPMPTRTGLPHCELWDPVTGTTAHDILNQAAASYPPALTLNRGFSQQVKVTFVYSCNRFFVHLLTKQDELIKLMTDLQEFVKDTPILNPTKIKVNTPCCALFKEDGQWYRAKIINDSIPVQPKVQYVDFGNEETVGYDCLKPIDGKHLTSLRPQAIECCLNGYQNMEANAERDSLLEEIILEQDFTMRVIDTVGKKALIDLIDANNYNVGSLLLEKIATSHLQVTPMLVQADNKIEQRKSRDNSFKKPDRNNRSGFERNENDDNSFRQPNKSFNRSERNNTTNGDIQRSFRGDNDSRNNDSNDNGKRGFNRSIPNRENSQNNDWGASGDSNWNKSQNNERSVTRKDRENSFTKPNRDGDRFSNNRKRTDFNRASSEISSDGSEKSARRGGKGRKDDSFKNKKSNDFQIQQHTQKIDNWADTKDPLANSVPNPASDSKQFKPYSFGDKEVEATISWFHNPSQFYILVENTQPTFRKMMEEIQEAYKGRQSYTAPIGAPIVALFPEDKVLYRARVLEIINGTQYKVYFVDFGNTTTTTKIWPIELQFMELPAQAICCKLHNVEPISGEWDKSNSYAKYFNRKKFTCQFVSNENNLAEIKLSVLGEDIGEGLVKDGLATLPKQVAPIETALLIGQQFRAMLLQFTNLENLTMALQNGALLNCSIFNATISSQKFPKNLNDKVSQVLIVYVDNVTDDNVVEVTLYSQDGIKIKLIDRDEEAYETVDLICQYVICYNTITGTVSHAENGTIYLQPDDCTDSINTMLDAIFESYDTTVQEQKIEPVVGYHYAAKGSDGNWYRAKVVNVLDAQVEINYIDYGNSESVESSNLRELTIDYMEFQVNCVPITITKADESLIGTYVTVSLRVTELGLDGTIQGEIPKSVSFHEPLVTESITEPIQVFTGPNDEPIQLVHNQVDNKASEANDTNQVKTDQFVPVYVSHIDSPSDFYLQLVESQASIDQLQADLQTQTFEPLESPTVGVLCAAPYSIDQLWYRAQVLDADADITTVRFIDFGNTDVLDNKVTQVKTLTQDQLSIEVHTTRSRLKIKPLEEEWSTAACERFEQLANGEAITAEFIQQSNKINFVNLYSNGINIGDCLVEENLAQKDEEVVEVKDTIGFVSHLNSPSEFWIQLENCVDDLEWIAEQLAVAERFKELEDLAPGTLCAALFPDDEMWYRARILSNTIAGIEVLFVDYGNSCSSCHLRELPEELVMLSPLARKCSLQKPDGMVNWSPEMVKKFIEISADGQTTFNVKKIKTGETALVDLLVDGVDVVSKLLPETVNIRVVACDDLNSLLLVKDGQELEGKYQLEQLVDLSWNQDSIDKFKSINVEGTVFQAEFVDEKIVRLYLGLNDVRLSLSGTKTPTDSPIKVRTEVNIKHSDSDSDGIVEDILNGMVDSVFDSDSRSIVDSILDEIIDRSVDTETELNRQVIETVLDEVINRVTCLNSLDCDNKSKIDSEAASPIDSGMGNDNSLQELS